MNALLKFLHGDNCQALCNTEKAMNRNWSNRKANPVLKTKMGNN